MKSPMLKTGYGNRIFLMFAGRRHKFDEEAFPAKEGAVWPIVIGALFVFGAGVIFFTLLSFFRHTLR